MPETISVNHLPDGLYLIDKPMDITFGLTKHSAILDIGNQSDLFEDHQPGVLHMDKAQGLMYIDLNSYTGNWQIQEGPVQGSQAQLAIKRIHQFIQNEGNEYSCLNTNCQHFAYYVLTGEKWSPGLWKGVGAFAGLLLLGNMFSSE
ncbi:MAG: hypothetical protein MK111_12180 [Crocosphaera sp.]|uniref:hypothetical protein n=1 Tax=Crocosphaera sp. TaxID=2729996 RepID=UPI0025881763|nr:hypothetical protein [Crocosphaera sp.]MCH2228075.1 hypothetical protein [Candidatus Caenarcaniphilales bacterium]MCH2245385.1 hypothetical protein [Crocosphaera sp.]